MSILEQFTAFGYQVLAKLKQQLALPLSYMIINNYNTIPVNYKANYYHRFLCEQRGWEGTIGYLDETFLMVVNRHSQIVVKSPVIGCPRLINHTCWLWMRGGRFLALSLSDLLCALEKQQNAQKIDRPRTYKHDIFLKLGQISSKQRPVVQNNEKRNPVYC